MSKFFPGKAVFSIHIFFLIALNSFAQLPVINSFSPVSAPVGSSVIISGSNFDVVAANNIVFFGAVKAPVTAGSVTSLTVTVPAGSTYEPITITSNGLTGYSGKSFLTTFTPGGALTLHSFVKNYDKHFLRIYGEPVSSDLDGDGKADLAIYEYSTLSLLRNSTTTAGISFDEPTYLLTQPFIGDIAVTDLDGDGLKDIVAVIAYSNKVSIFRNTSTPGNFSFVPGTDLNTSNSPQHIVSSDIDNDGKPDLVVSNSGDSSVSVFRNISSGSAIAFSPKISFLVGSRQRPAISDIDGDGKGDLVLANDYLNTISLFRNTSLAGIISFEAKVDIPSGANPLNVIIADLDGDSKPELAVTTLTANTFSIFRNTSIIGSFSFAPKNDFAAGIASTSKPMDIAIGELDGDGKPDLFVSCDDSNIYFLGSHSIFRNSSLIGNISFDPKVNAPISGYSRGTLIADIDGDGKSDLTSLFTDDFQSFLRIDKNRVAEPVDVVLCPPADNTILTSDLSGVNYQWKFSTDSITFSSLYNNSNYSGVNTPTLQLNNIASSSYGYLYRCITDGNSSEVFRLRFQNEWRWFGTHIQWEDASGWSCGTVPDMNTDVIIHEGAILTLNSNTTIRSLTISPGASLTIGSGYTLMILH